MSDQKNIKRNLIISAVLTLILFYLGAGHGLLNLPFPEILRNNQIFLLVIRVILSLLVIFVNRALFTKGISSIIHLSPDMDSLVVLGALAAFIYSTAVSVINIIYYKNADEYIGESELYFESCALILTIVAIGKLLEEIAKGRTSDAIKDLSDMSPKTALILVGGQEREVSIEEVKVGDTFILKPGMSVPVDGIIESGTSAVNESALTGESVPVSKHKPKQSKTPPTLRLSNRRCRVQHPPHPLRRWVKTERR